MVTYGKQQQQQHGVLMFQYFHERIRNYECSYCEKKFQAKKLLYNHVQVSIEALKH